MATFDVPTNTIVTIYDATGNLVGEGPISSIAAFTVTDGNPLPDNTFTTSESLTYQSGATTLPASFDGNLPFSGQTYPVFSTANFTYVIGATVSSTYPNTASLLLTTSPFTVCFAEGTLISTPLGERAVESLGIGDHVRCADGREVAVKWIGRQTVSTRFGPAERLMPVRFSAGSLGDGLPHSDLTVTADHGMLVGSAICHAGALVNGTTITQVPLAEMGETYTVYHIETEAHEIILSNGAPTETFIDNVSRRAFDNFAEFDALYGDVPEMEELPYARAMSARQVPVEIQSALGLPARHLG
ncbi:Hint domain-containing protein [Nioella sp. MMSF_3534]|uniref:Hint domain-containing protein n=1 Tax=Nioella sp. MMSF_3534 TaxID=3046720 RepID=UPI00273E6A4F|nr:Hint domain-containing protein [Nioella sp. MMSF_3534]